ncbi:MAG TPA: glycoside hydrolase family 2 TIM barrel-domain containing protein [Candidatus Limnocylindrales bacterium]|nr:glycoside hydrolase family 2 TIM barrel-domain containing protein [Candidatus Limnocylindrales bacterium]
MQGNDSITRRTLLGSALGAAALASAFDRTAAAQTLPPARLHDSFDFGWKFLKGDAPGAEAVAFADGGWRSLDVPHDWSVEGPFAQNEPSGGAGGNAPTGIGWYRKHFRVPASYQGRKVAIDFDGVYQNSEVWINGQYLGKRPFGYISFSYDLTPHLNWSGDNVVAVKVDNSRQPGSRWYSGSGIYRHTWLTAVNPAHVAQWGTFVTTPRVSKDAATVNVRTRVGNARASGATCTLGTAIVDRDGKVVQSHEVSQQIAPNGEYEFTQQLTVTQPNLWSVNSPYLYKVCSTVSLGGQISDDYETPLGIREAIFDADRGFLLNGEHVKLNGVCLHHDAGCLGAAVPERVWERRLETLREMGCNAIRTSHNPPAPEFLDLCDRMGFLVMNEAFDEWMAGKGQVRGNGYSLHFAEWHERDVTDFVRRDRNHPSVVLWSCGNEIPDQLSAHGVEILRDLLDIFHREDPTRFVTAACDQIAAEPKAASPEFLGMLDVVGYNYADRWRERKELYYSEDKLAHPGWRMIGTESIGMGGVRGDYRGMEPLAPGQTPAAAPTGGRGGGRGFGRGMRGLDTEELWRFVRTHDYVAGDFMWTGIDYLGESFWPNHGASSGCIDSCGFPKDGYYFYQSQWTTKPMLYLFPHWNWKGREGQFLTVVCYTNCDNVELFVNGKSVGMKGYAFPRFGMQGRYGQAGPQAMNGVRTTNDLHLAWDVPYEPGTLRAVATKGGQVVATQEIATTGEPAAIEISADRDAIRADRRDVAHMTVKVVDAEGRVHPDADNEIMFDVQGDGKLIGVDNGDMSNAEDYKGKQKKAFHGMCLGIVQATATAGRIRVTASSPGLKPATVTITTRA